MLYLLLAHRLRLPATVVETEAGELVLEILPGTLERGVHILPPPLPAGASQSAVAGLRLLRHSVRVRVRVRES